MMDLGRYTVIGACSGIGVRPEIGARLGTGVRSEATDLQ